MLHHNEEATHGRGEDGIQEAEDPAEKKAKGIKDVSGETQTKAVESTHPGVRRFQERFSPEDEVNRIRTMKTTLR